MLAVAKEFYTKSKAIRQIRSLCTTFNFAMLRFASKWILSGNTLFNSNLLNLWKLHRRSCLPAENLVNNRICVGNGTENLQLAQIHLYSSIIRPRQHYCSGLSFVFALKLVINLNCCPRRLYCYVSRTKFTPEWVPLHSDMSSCGWYGIVETRLK